VNETNEPTDLIITYTVEHSGVVATSGYERLQDALARGYRVVDILTSQSQASSGFIAVTVLLARNSSAPGQRTLYRRAVELSAR
jgi:hypothetical protein